MLRLPPLEFRAPTKLSEALAALEGGGANGGGRVRLVAGGTDLWPNMKRRHQQAETVVSLMSIDELRRIEQTARGLTLGSTVTLTGLLRNPAVRDRYPGFARAVAAISSPPLRNMGTLGGNLCVDTRCTYYNQTEEWRRSIDYCMKEQGTICWVATNSPRCWAHSASDAAPMLCALGARVKLVSAAGEREIPLADFYRDDGIDYLGMRPGEILTEVFVPNDADSEHCRSAFWKLRRRGSIDFSVLSVAVALWMDESNAISRAAVCLGAVGSSPVAVSAAEELLVGKTIDEDLIAAVAHQARKDATPMSNTDFVPAWRGKMAEHYTHAALCEAAGLPVRRRAPKHGLTVV
ncbi:MAG: FAD binding domain-containing protein [Rhodospirillaceae bacterium]|nr:FAD binding domain-containing protein [Rhodospirillaceae bacterium]